MIKISILLLMFILTGCYNNLEYGECYSHGPRDISRRDGSIAFKFGIVFNSKPHIVPKKVSLVIAEHSYPMKLDYVSKENNYYKYFAELPESTAKEGIKYRFTYKLDKSLNKTDEYILKYEIPIEQNTPPL